MRLECPLNWNGDEVDELGCDEPSDHGTDKYGDQRIDDALAQFNEVLEKRHLAPALIGCGRCC